MKLIFEVKVKKLNKKKTIKVKLVFEVWGRLSLYGSSDREGWISESKSEKGGEKNEIKIKEKRESEIDFWREIVSVWIKWQGGMDN